MEAELVALAGSGASTLVGLMVSDGWEQVRRRVARLLARDGDEASAEAELERSRDGVVAARDAGDEDGEADYRDEWSARLRRFLRNDPQAARELFALLAELGPPPERDTGGVHNTISGDVRHSMVVQGRDFSGGFTCNGPSATGTDR